MKIYNIASSTVLIESNSSKILMDPWILDGEYYGSWNHFPKLNLVESFLQDVTHIYVSHIHPDHFSRKSFDLFNKSIPVLIHNYSSKFLKLNIERLGFNVIELDNNKEYALDKKTRITIVAADNCNPELCSKFFGCAFVENRYQSTQIDSMAIITDGEYSILNTNDCPYELAEKTLDNILVDDFKNIDLLLVGYAGAGPYPQCFKMNEIDKSIAAKNKEIQFLNLAIRYIEKVKPKYYMPFAGTYILGGSLANLNKFRGVPDIQDALKYFKENIKYSNGFLLNSYSFFDLKNKQVSDEYIPFELDEKDRYVNEVLIHCKFDYEHDDVPNEFDILNLLSISFDRFLRKKNEINFNSETKLFISLSDKNDMAIDLGNDCKYEIVEASHYLTIHKFLRISLDSRLLYRILKGPKFAHWNNAEIGSHLTFERNPNIFERGLYHCLSFFHS
jgi:UDP-MurNAc hydroxylase